MFVWTFINIPSLSMQAGKALVRLCRYAGSSKFSLLAYALSTKISLTGLNYFDRENNQWFSYLFFQINSS